MKMKIATKITLGNMLVIALLVILSFIGIRSLSVIEEKYRMVTDVRMPVALMFDELKYEILRESYSVRGFMLTGNTKFIDDFKTARQNTELISKEMKELIVTPQAKEFLAQIEELNER